METHQTTDLGIAGSIPAGLVFLCIYSYIPPCVLSIWDYLYCYIIFKHSKTLKNDIVEKKLLLKYSRCKHVSLNKKKKKERKKQTNKQTKKKENKRKRKEKEKKKERKRKEKGKQKQKQIKKQIKKQTISKNFTFFLCHPVVVNSLKVKSALGRSRTCDPGVISTMLYRLSYESLH